MSLSVATILAESAHRHPDKVAVVQGEQQVTYAELWQQALRYAAVFRDRGIERGDRVALLVPNVADFPRCYYAALALGAVVVPVHALLTADEVAATLRDAGASLLVATG
ncbi:MAG: AMP-binding protein, partial [Nocardioidaceae bacterium]|nr:AMP-binding protein [Nocardioidaceae bacterium]